MPKREVPAVPHRPTADRLRVWLAAFVGSVVMVLVLEAPRWIPEWQVTIDGLIACLMLAAAASSVAAFNAARHRIGQRFSPKWRTSAYVALGVLMFAVWSFGALIAIFAVGGAPFAATYSRQVHFAEFETTIYLYDSTFLDPETTVYLRRGWLPLREQVMHLGRAPEHVAIVRRGDVLMIGDRALDLRNSD